MAQEQLTQTDNVLEPASAETQAFEALKAQYDHGDDDKLEWPDAEPEQEEEAIPSDTESEEAEPEQEEIAEPAPRAAQADDRGALQDRRIWQLEQELAQLRQPKQEKPVEKDPLDELAADLDPRLVNFMRSNRDQVKSLTEQNQALAREIQRRDQEAVYREFESWMAETGDVEFFGEGSINDGAISQEHFANRRETLSMMDAIRASYAQRGINLSWRDAFLKATGGVKAGTKTKAAKTPAKTPAKAVKRPAKAAPVPEPEDEPADEAPEEVPTELEKRRQAYRGAAVSRPTQRVQTEGPGKDKAVKTAARLGKQLGFFGDNE